MAIVTRARKTPKIVSLQHGKRVLPDGDTRPDHRIMDTGGLSAQEENGDPAIILPTDLIGLSSSSH
ncbi:hypothetical protein PGT21_012873 [Puccinia graminis f. sp. tritici]|uniref:Uncharacterized protein n=1 Tax=Puccinia graminis f. sp. tritici TaxID=56615 RepID=A0A5B0Q5S9_PUCGR|nr:hypothetical protein PGT21_012873 [Puccinia graminis f. sp. tritici]